MTAAMCGICAASAPNMAFASGAEIENRDKVIEESLILPEDIAYISETLSTYLWDKETNTPTMDAFIELDKDKKIIVVADNEEILANIKAFVKEKALDESLIGYRVEDFEAMVPDGYTVETPVTNDELEKLLAVWKSLNTSPRRLSPMFYSLSLRRRNTMTSCTTSCTKTSTRNTSTLTTSSRCSAR